MLNKLTKIKRLLLIGKEIWHNKRSMRGRFIIYLLSLVLLAGSAMLILLNVIIIHIEKWFLNGCPMGEELYKCIY